MKSIPSTVLRAFRSVFALFLSLLSVVSFAQSRKETVGGAALSFEVEKDYGRFLSLSVEEEVRLTGSGPGFDRSVTAVGADYAFINRRLKVGAHYAFQYLYNKDDLYEPRHRVYLNMLYRQAFAPFTLSWRGRLQSTLRDENRSSYRINPKHVMKNRIRAEYEIWGSPWKPFLSLELSSDLNDPKSASPARIRYQGGASWRLNRTGYMDFFIRFDRHTSVKDPDAIFLGVEYKIKL